jgi:DNA-binding transcriptional LysR family regulator
MDLDLSWLRAFTAVGEELHFGRAALRIGISQPQVSRQVRSLEDHLGVELFIRTARRTELTDAGVALLGDARETLAAAERLRTRAAAERRGARGHVSVAFLWSTLSGYLAPLVAAAGERHPEIEMTVSQATYLELLPALRRGDIDLAIARPTYEQSEIIEIELRPEPAVVAVHPEHPFADRDEVEIAELSTQPVIALARSLMPAAYDAALARARARGRDVDIVRHVRSAAEALALVSAGIGVYRLPVSAASPFPGVLYRPLASTQSRLVLLHRPFPRRPVARIVELVIELFGDASTASNDASSALDVRTAAT